MSLPERFWSKVRKTEGCWLWTAGKYSNGYGQFSIGDQKALAHRLSYEQANGKIPKDLQIDHLCRVRHCVNPSHLELVTSRENTMRGENFSATNARKTHCPQGHEYSVENTRRDNKNRRYCKACGRIRDKVRAPKRKQQRRDRREAITDTIAELSY